MSTSTFSDINIACHISRLRREKGLTQDQLADFLGVTKASVSKWENRLSMPDIALLPELASFFDVTIDDLIGYAPQLSKQQIQRIYQELAADFSSQEFESVMNKTKVLVKKYYTCYPFLFQIAVLWLNHFMIAKPTKRQKEILSDTAVLCSHICENAEDVGIRNDASSIKAVALLQSGQASEVIEMLEDRFSPNRLGDYGEMTLVQAYLAHGDHKKAKQFAQLSIYSHLMGVFAGGLQYLMVCMQDFEVARETISRLEALMDTFEVEHLHPNTAAQVRYISAMVYMTHGHEEDALIALRRYKANVDRLLNMDPICLHGDAFFDTIEDSFESLDMSGSPPRNPKLIKESYRSSFDHPIFEPLKNRSEFKSLIQNNT